MVLVRWILGRIILVIDFLTSPRGVTRPADEQARLDQETAQLTLYQFQACPFCVKVRRFLKRHSLRIETRDAKRNPTHRAVLQDQGGQIKVPCLRIRHDAGQVDWLYESSEIIQYLEQRFLTEAMAAQPVSARDR